MPLLARTISTPLFIEVRRGAIEELGTILSDRRLSAGGGVAVVVGPGQGERIAELIKPTLGGADIFTVGGGTLESALQLGEQLKGHNYDLVVGIGGGKTIDTTKYAATRYGIPMVSVATSLANDGIASPISTLDNDGGRGSYGVHIPIAAIVDLDFVESGSDRQTRAGVGELLSNLSAIADWELSHKVNGEPIDGLAVTMARIGAEGMLHHPGDLSDDSFLTFLAESLISSGVAIAICGTSRPSSGGCHEISHALDLLMPGTASHGEQCGLGALFCTFLRGDEKRFNELNACLKRHGLPRTRPERFTILEHLDLGREEIAKRVADYANAVGS